MWALLFYLMRNEVISLIREDQYTCLVCIFNLNEWNEVKLVNMMDITVELDGYRIAYLLYLGPQKNRRRATHSVACLIRPR